MSNLAATLMISGETGEAKNLHHHVFEKRLATFGPHNPSTSISAWNLYETLASIGENEAAEKILSENLMWLLDQDPNELGAMQRNIIKMIQQVIKS